MVTQQAKTTGATTSMPTTDGYILLAKIKPGQANALRAAIAEAAKIMMDPKGALAQLAKVHFARMATLGDDYLLFTSWFDGDMEAYLDDFFSFTSGGGGFDVVLRYCEGWPGTNDREGFMNFWKSHKVKDLAQYSYYPGVTCKEIEKALRIGHNMEAVLQDFQ
ncbi:MAG: hypothetical protein JOZ18_12425 [Chloroflexi bacterium]|nr:hypothetical protein [Chloroflexota bacterium]